MAAKKVLETEKCYGQEIDLSNYTHIRAYHACRPENVQLYADVGLIPYDEASALNDALQKLSGGNISERKTREQFNKMWENSDAYQHSVVWLALLIRHPWVRLFAIRFRSSFRSSSLNVTMYLWFILHHPKILYHFSWALATSVSYFDGPLVLRKVRN